MRFVSFGLCALLAAFTGCRTTQKNSPGSFYPIGIYAVGNTNDLAGLKQAGFNVVVGRADRGYLDAAQGARLMVLAPPGTSAGPGFSAAIARETVRALDRHPALWAWYLVDEPDLNEIPPEEVTEAQRCVKAAGARKPTALVLYQGYQSLHYANLADITMIDRYPIPWLPLANFGQHLTMGRLALGQGKPLIAVIQAFDWSSCQEMLPGEANLRPPTFEEIRCMTYEALARGANGLFYYAADNSRWKMREHQETWAALCTVVREVNDRLPLFEASPQWWAKRHRFGDRDRRFNSALESSVTSVLLRVSAGNALVTAGDYILAVNNTEQTQVYSFALPERGKAEMLSLFQNPPKRRVWARGLQESGPKPACVGPLPSAGAVLKAPLLKAESRNLESAVPVLDEHRSLAPQKGRVTDSFSPYAVWFTGRSEELN